jgi:hypothetical protein
MHGPMNVKNNMYPASPDKCILFVVNKQLITNTWNMQHLTYNCCTTVLESTAVCSNSATNE